MYEDSDDSVEPGLVIEFLHLRSRTDVYACQSFVEDSFSQSL